MKKNKLYTGMAVLALSLVVFTACGSDQEKETKSSSSTVETTESSVAKVASTDELQDGTYTLEEKNESNGYRAVFSMTVEGGKITDSNYDNVNAAGDSKTKDTEYQDKMKEVTNIGPAEFIPQLNEAFLAAQSASGVEVVTGASHSTVSFKNYAQQLIQAAQAGNTEVIEIDNGAELKDGSYTLEEKNYANGYRVVFTMEVKGGKITQSNYDYVNEAGDSKTKDAEYNKSMKDVSGTSPDLYVPELNAGLVEKQVPAEVEVVTGATNSSSTFQMYGEQLVNAAEKGDTAKIEINNIVTE